MTERMRNESAFSLCNCLIAGTSFFLFVGFVASLDDRSSLLLSDLLGENWEAITSKGIANSLALPQGFGRVLIFSIIADGVTMLLAATTLFLIGSSAFPRARVIGCALVASIPSWFLVRDFFSELNDLPLHTLLALKVTYALDTTVCATVLLLALQLGGPRSTKGERVSIAHRIGWGLLLTLVLFASIDGWMVVNDYRRAWLDDSLSTAPVDA